MKVAVVLSLAVVLVAAVPSKRFISIHEVEHGLHNLGHEIEHGLQLLTGLSEKDLACKIYPYVKDEGERVCDAKCVALVAESLAPLCPSACHVVFHEADKLANC